MKILDLDMDYFLQDVPVCIPSNSVNRVDENFTIPWSKEDVISFLENNLGLSKEHKIQGKIVKHHHEALYYWRELINTKKLNVPFEVVHVDSHADLALGCSSWIFIFDKLLGIDVEKRADIENYKNMFDDYRLPDYLLYALA